MSAEAFPHAITLATGASQDDVVIGVTDGSGRRQWLSLSSRLLSGAGQSESPVVVCSFTDVTDRKAAEAQLHWLAYHDSLTGLGNRSLFNDELERELLVSMQRGTNLAVLFIDLDRFKLVNDSFGHASGDEVLLALAQRFKSAVRGGDVVSRFSGDEFVVLCRNVHDVEVAVSLATEYSRLLSEPVQLSTGRNVVVTSQRRDLLRDAGPPVGPGHPPAGRRGHVPGQEQGPVPGRGVRRVAPGQVRGPTRDLRRSAPLDRPQRAGRPLPAHRLGQGRPDRGHGGTGAVAPPVAGTARARWSSSPSPRRPTSSSRWGAGSCGRHARPWSTWRRELPGAENAYITVNLSAHQLSDPELLETIDAALTDSGLPPEALVMEVTESMLMSDTSASIAMLGGIHEMGVGLAIDDFGTGYSSLAQLKRFPVKILKIDKSFVDGLGAFENDEAIVAAIVQLSKALGLVVLAEGVERPVQLQRVTELGCDLYQGYLMSRPTQADNVDFNKQVSYSESEELEAGGSEPVATDGAASEPTGSTAPETPASE